MVVAQSGAFVSVTTTPVNATLPVLVTVRW